MFLLPLLLLRGRSWLDRFDIAVVLSFGISYALFDTGHLEPAVWLFYPPLLYLLVRMVMRGARARRAAGRLDCRLPTAVLSLGLLALIVARVVLTLHPAGVIDVGTASALGAFKILHGQSIYYISNGHGDTYGPLAYLAYVPFEAIWSRHVDIPARCPRGDDHFRPAHDRRPDAARRALAPRARGTPPGPAAGVAVGRLPVHSAGHGRRTPTTGWWR